MSQLVPYHNNMLLTRVQFQANKQVDVTVFSNLLLYPRWFSISYYTLFGWDVCLHLARLCRVSVDRVSFSGDNL